MPVVVSLSHRLRSEFQACVFWQALAEGVAESVHREMGTWDTALTSTSGLARK